MRWRLRTLGVLERVAAGARRFGFGALVDRLAAFVGRPFERFVLDVDGIQLGGASLSQLHYVRELVEHRRERTFVRLLAEATPTGGTVLEGGAYLGYVTIHAAIAAGLVGPRLRIRAESGRAVDVAGESGSEPCGGTRRRRSKGTGIRRRKGALPRAGRHEQPVWPGDYVNLRCTGPD